MNDVVLTFVSVDEILWCDHLNETSLPVLRMILFAFQYYFYKMQVFFGKGILILGTFGVLFIHVNLHPICFGLVKMSIILKSLST